MANQNDAGMAKPVIVVETGEIYTSRSKAAKALGCSASAVYNAIKSGRLINGWHLLDASTQANADALGDATDDNMQADETDITATYDERSVLLKQLETKDSQIKNLQSSISCLLMQLKDRDARLDKAQEEIDELHQQLDNVQSYYAKALNLCEKRTDELASANRPVQHSISRQEALRIALFGGDVTTRHEKEA